MTEESSAGIPAQFKDMMTENEKRIKAIQDQIANQWDDQRKTIADLIEAQQNAVADFLAQQGSPKIAEQGEAQRKAIADQVEQQWNDQRKAITELVEKQWDAQKKAIEDAQNAIGG